MHDIRVYSQNGLRDTIYYLGMDILNYRDTTHYLFLFFQVQMSNEI